jgi:uncharacterized repeat protein (TIGR03899 family)
MEIKDLTGLSKPLTKLVEVLANSVGAFSEPYLIRKKADAKAYEIKVIADSIKENQNSLKEIGYSESKLSLSSNSNELTVNERTKNRLDFKENKRQENIENITQKAAKNLESESEVSDEPVDEDWSTRFFNYAEDISNNEMQELWGQILAGEIKQPKSYSLRTLEVLRNITKEEAEIFIKSSNLVISSSNSPFLFKGENDLLSKYDFTFEDRLLLTEIGIIQPETNISRGLNKTGSDLLTYFESGNYLIKITKKANTKEYRIPIFRFSKIGGELLKLLTPNPNSEYLKEFCMSFESEKMETEYAFIVSIEGNAIQHSQPWMKFS